MKQILRLSAADLTTIRHHTDWRQLFTVLGIDKDPKKSRQHDWWCKSPFRPDERTASFHINDRGWFCHATGQGGGPIELVQRLHRLNCYAAGKWLLEHGVSSIVADTRSGTGNLGDEGTANQPIRQDLRSRLSASHGLCQQRGIPPEIYRQLGAGYLERPPRKNGKPDPLNRRIVFQIRGVEEDDDGELQSVILSHTGRATTDEQAAQDGKWWTYPGFRKSRELYNLDLAVLVPEAREQAQGAGHILIVEGCFDVAKLRAAGIRNVVATFGAQLSEQQVERLRFLTKDLGIERVRLFFDRDQAGEKGTAAAFHLLSSEDIAVTAFNWNQTWHRDGEEILIPASICDPADFSLGQLLWLRAEGLL